jgi:hypothetical protein
MPTPVVEQPVVVPSPEVVMPEERGSDEPAASVPAVCRTCGTVNTPGGLFCTACGASLQGKEGASMASPTPEPVIQSVPTPIITPVSEPEPVRVQGSVPVIPNEPVAPPALSPPEPVSEPASTPIITPVFEPVPESVPERAPEPVVPSVPAVEPVIPVVSEKRLSAAGIGPWLPSLIGFFGGLLLIVGTFTPMMQFATAPVSTFNTDAGMGVLFIGFGIGALLLGALKWFRELQVLGAVTLFLIGFVFWRINSTFAGIGSATAGSGLSFQWGWAVLVIGAILLLSARLVALRRP